MLFGRKKESATERDERLRQARKEMQSLMNEGKHEYDAICTRTNAILLMAGKPKVCNTIRFASEPYCFPDLLSYQLYFVDWEIWVYHNVLYIYRSEITDYTENYADADAPAIAQIPISDIKSIRVEGSITSETKITGGKVSQNRYTGRVSQTKIKSKTEQHDNRVVRMCIEKQGTLKTVDFEYSSYDVLSILLPEKLK